MNARTRTAREPLPVVTDVRIQKGKVIGVQTNGEEILLARLDATTASLPAHSRAPRKRKAPLTPTPTDGTL
jgi:hypothetical protein